MSIRKYFIMIIVLSLFVLTSLHAQVPSELKAKYNQLLQLNNSNRYDEVIILGKVIIAENPNFGKGYEHLAFAFEKANKIDQGLAFFDSLQQENRENPYNYFAIALMEKSQKKYEQAIENLKRCIKLNPEFAPGYFHFVEIYNAQKDLQTPENYFHSLLQEDSLNAAAYYGLGCIYQNKKEWEKGAEVFGKSLAINPELVHAYYLKGLMYIYKRDLQNALDTWDKGKDVAAKLNDLEWQGKMTANVGNVYHEMGQFPKSIPYREKALKLANEIGDKKQESRHLGNLANTYKELRQYEKADDYYQKAMEIATAIKDSIYQETILGNLSAMYVSKGDFKRGVKYGLKALETAEARGDSSAVASHCWNTGAGYANLTEYDLALKYVNRAIAIKKQDGDMLSVGRLLGNLGNIYKDMGDVSKAIEVYSQSLQIARDLPHKPLEEFALGSLGYAYSGLSEYSKANEYFHRAFAIAEDNNDINGMGIYLGNIGVIHKKWGNFKEALEKLEKALQIHQQASNPRSVIRHYVNTANIYEIRGDYVRSLDLENKALVISDSIGTKDYTAIILGNMGVAYDKIGDLDKALHYFGRALNSARAIPSKGSIASILANMGSVYEKMDNDTDALAKFNESYQAAKEVENKEDQASALAAIGDIYTRSKKFSDAMKQYNQAMELVKNMGQKNQEGHLYLNIGKVYLEEGDFAAAWSHCQKALEIGKKMDAFDLLFESYAAIATVAEKQKHYNEAIEYYKQGIDKIESVRERLRIESYKTTFMDSKLSIYESLITLFIRLGKFEDAYDYLQRFRARSFLESLTPQYLDLTADIPPELYTKYQAEEQIMREINDRLAMEYGKIDSLQDQNLLVVLSDSLERASLEHEKLIAEISKTHPRWAEANGLIKPLNLSEIQQQVLKPSKILIEYFLGPEITAAWVVKSDTFHCVTLPVQSDEVTKLIEKFRQPFTDIRENRVHNLADVQFHATTAKRLYEALFQPLEHHLDRNAQLIIIPDGVLYYLPFEALVTGIDKKQHDPAVIFSRYENFHYLLEKYAVSYAPSASVLSFTKSIKKTNEQKSAAQLLAFGSPDFGKFNKQSSASTLNLSTNYLRGRSLPPVSQQDVREVSQVIQPARLFLNQEATEEHFKKETNNFFTYIYLSTHAIVNENQPMYSLIAFAQGDDSKEDGLLFMYEVFNLPLHADLVTLSCCETGLGKLSRGEGMIGLSRAFLCAGTPSLLASLWSVDEYTARIMKDFYQNIKTGMPKSEALRQAKLKWMKTRIEDPGKPVISFSHPFLWAPFVLIGQGE